MRDFLVYKFADGARYEDPGIDSPGTATPLGYPNWWLEDVGYQNGPPSEGSDDLSTVHRG